MDPSTNNHAESHFNPYARFPFIMAVSFVVMYVVMYFQTYTWNHIIFSEMRFYMTSLMILAMMMTMLFMMRGMDPDCKKNLGILVFALISFATVAYI